MGMTTRLKGGKKLVADEQLEAANNALCCLECLHFTLLINQAVVGGVLSSQKLDTSLRSRLHVDNMKERVLWLLEARQGGDPGSCEGLWALPLSLTKDRLGLSEEAAWSPKCCFQKNDEAFAWTSGHGDGKGRYSKWVSQGRRQSIKQLASCSQQGN